MYWNTVTPLLREVLHDVMATPIFNAFRLVGGTSLSLQLGHRESVDIDLFTDAAYGSIDFRAIVRFFNKYTYCTTNSGQQNAPGFSCFVGNDNDAVKLDIYYTDLFIRPSMDKEGIRLASPEDIIGMKLEVLGQGGRKKDFWDLHALHDRFSIEDMLNFHQERHPYTFTPEQLRAAFVNFDKADDDLDPICLLNKQWPLVKLDFLDWLEKE